MRKGVNHENIVDPKIKSNIQKELFKSLVPQWNIINPDKSIKEINIIVSSV